MNERVVQFRVGVVVIATILIVLLLIMLISGDELFDLSQKYPVRIQFSSAPGVAPGTPVHKNGVLIGRVTELQLNDDGVSVVANINDDVTLKNTDMPRVTSSLLRGDASIEFVPNRRDGDGSRLAPGAELKGEVQPDPIESFASMQGDIGTTVKALGDAGNQVAELADRVNGMLGDVDTARFDDLLQRTDAAITSFTRTMDNVNRIIGDEELQRQLREGISGLPALIDDSRQTMARVQDAIDEAEANLQNLRGLTDPLGERGEQIASSLESAADNLDALLAQAAKFTAAINNQDGTLGQLLTKRDLYDNVNAVVCDVQQLIRRLRPIVDDVRTFTDKIARHPERIGAQGLIKEYPGLK